MNITVKLSGANSIPLGGACLSMPEQLASSNLSDEIHRASDVDSGRLRSISTTTLIVPRSKHSKIGDRTFPITAANVWNTLPVDVTSAPLLSSFKWRLKTELFKRCHTSFSVQ